MTYVATSPMTDTSPLVRTAAAVSLGAAVLSLVDLIALHVVRPDLAPGGHVLSEYAIGYEPLGIASFALQAIACLGLAVALLKPATTPGVRIGTALIALAGIGLGLAAIFPMDPLTTPAGQETFSGTMHGVSALIGIPSIIAATLVLSYALRRRPAWQASGGRLVALAHLTWLGLAIMVACMALMLGAGVAAAGEVVGWGNRLLVVAYSLWVALAAAPLLKAR